LKNYVQVVRKRLTWRGFLVFDPNIAQHRAARDDTITKWIQEGTFHSQDHCTRGMDNAIDGFLGMLKGENLGKSFVWIQDP
jgi:NADPH-dependent curcumin reductase CurA